MRTLFFHSPHIPTTANNKQRKKGRVSIAAIVHDNGIVKFGVAKCSKKDNFSRKLGREIALNRAANTDTAIMWGPIPSDVGLMQWFRDTALLLSLDVLAGNAKVKPV